MLPDAPPPRTAGFTRIRGAYPEGTPSCVGDVAAAMGAGLAKVVDVYEANGVGAKLAVVADAAWRPVSAVSRSVPEAAAWAYASGLCAAWVRENCDGGTVAAAEVVRPEAQAFCEAITSPLDVAEGTFTALALVGVVAALPASRLAEGLVEDLSWAAQSLTGDPRLEVSDLLYSAFRCLV